MQRQRILTGDRPTGRLHLGHYVGSLQNRVRLQDDYECFFIIADLHVLTTRNEHLEEIKDNIRELILDYLSVGIDPRRSTIYVQSLVPEVTELFTIFAMLTSVPRLQRVPTLKEVMRDLRIETASLGLLSYPVLQAADILMVRANLVPVGKDQTSHVEVTRETAQRFNMLYGPVFPIPEALIGEVPTLPGIDGKAKAGGDLFDLHQWIKNEPVDLLIGNTYGKYIARAEDIPFVRVGFPILDRSVHSYLPIVGYRGAMRLVEMISGALLDRADRDAAEEDFELVM